MTALAIDVRELEDIEIQGISGGDIILPITVDLPWPHGPILTGTGPYGGDPKPDTTF